MKSKKLSLGDYLAEQMPDDLKWNNRPHGYEAGREFSRRRHEWCQLHHINPLQLIRHDVAAKRAALQPLLDGETQ